MAHQFQRHYSLAEARALLPQVSRWLARLGELRGELETHDATLRPAIAEGRDLGGHPVNRWLMAAAELKDVAAEFAERDIQIKDLDRGLVDFPAIINGREVFLCWERGEDDIEFWHDLDAGYAGREPL